MSPRASLTYYTLVLTPMLQLRRFILSVRVLSHRACLKVFNLWNTADLHRHSFSHRSRSVRTHHPRKILCDNEVHDQDRGPCRNDASCGDRSTRSDGEFISHFCPNKQVAIVTVTGPHRRYHIKFRYAASYLLANRGTSLHHFHTQDQRSVLLSVGY